MFRCPQCGLRLYADLPVCPDHGAIVRTASDVASTLENASFDARVTQHFDALGLHVEQLLGRGGFGSVYAVTREVAPRRLALKVAAERRDAIALLAHEAKLLSELAPPLVPEVLQHGTLADLTFLLMEQITAPTLASRLLEAHGPLPLAELSACAEALFAALESLHARGIVHLDLKPENIFIEGPIARLIDFGLAQREGVANELTRSAQLGTAEYMSPEQCDDRAALDQRSDIYSLGVLLYELATGAPPFFGNPADVREAHRSQRARPLPARRGLPQALDLVLRRCLAKEPARRFEEVSALRVAFATALASETRSADAGTDVRPRIEQTSSAEKRAVGLLFFSSQAGLGAVRTQIASGGGQIAHQQGSDYAAAFSHDVGDNPVAAALSVAQRLLARGLTTRALVELATISVQPRTNGAPRLLSPLFAKRDRYPGASAPPGILLTRSAAEVLRDLSLAQAPGDSDRFVLASGQSAHEVTSFALDAQPLVGREPVLARLRESAQRAVAEARPTLFTLLGDTGLGKTHLARSFATELAQLVPGMEVLRFTARELSIGAASQLLPELLRRVLELPVEDGPPDPAAMRALLRARLAPDVDEQVLAAALFILGSLDGAHPDVRRLAAAPGALRVAAARAAGEALRTRAREHPLALLLDDAHLADEATLDALEFATFADRKLPIWIAVCARPNFSQARPNWARRSKDAPALTLSPLEPAAADALARRLLQPVEYLPPDALTRLRERTQCIPALLVELVRGLKREGIVRRSERGTGYYLATDALDKLPELPIVAWNAIREFEALPAQLAEHACLAAVLGSDCTRSDLEALLQVIERDEGDAPRSARIDAGVGLDRLVEAGILVRRRDRTFEFRHALLRETIYQRIPEPRRSDLHRAALEVFDKLTSRSERALPRLALHAARCREHALAADTYLELAQRAQQAHRYLEAEAAYATALEQLTILAVDSDEGLAEDGSERSLDGRVLAAARGRGLMRFRLGRHEDALGDLRRARRESSGELALQLMLDEATVLDWMRDFVQSAELTQRAAELPGAHSELARARLAMSLARLHHRLGDAAACVRIGHDAARRAAELGDEGYETQVSALLMVAPDCVNLGQLDEAERHFDEVIRAAKAHGDQHHLGAAYVNRALLWFARKETQQLFDDLARGAQIARELGAPLIEYPARINMGEVAYALEELEHAQEHTERAIVLARQLWGDDNRELGMCELLLARIALHRGELERARELTTRLRSRIDEARAQGSSEADFLPAEHALLEMVELSTRDADELAWQELESRCRSVDMQPHEQVAILESRALAALRAGRRDESRAAFERAIALSEATPNLLGERVVKRARELFTA